MTRVGKCDQQKYQRGLRGPPSEILAFHRSFFLSLRVGGWMSMQATRGPLAALRLAALRIIRRLRLPSVCLVQGDKKKARTEKRIKNGISNWHRNEQQEKRKRKETSLQICKMCVILYVQTVVFVNFVSSNQKMFSKLPTICL